MKRVDDAEDPPVIYDYSNEEVFKERKERKIEDNVPKSFTLAEVETPSLPSHLSQIVAVFGMQMRLYAKSISVYLFLIFVALIPILAATDFIRYFVEEFPVVPTAILLGLLPIFITLIPANLSGKVMPYEFKNRTAHLNFPLPVSRMTFYFGKYIAAFTLAVGLFMLVYAVAILSSSYFYGPIFSHGMSDSIIICICGIFAVSATAFGIGTLLKRGAGAISMGLFMALPWVILYFLQMYSGDYANLPGSWENIKTLPMFAGYNALASIDSLSGVEGIGEYVMDYFVMNKPMYYMIITSAVWGSAFLALGAWVIHKKEL
jgi:hypothetical protein